MSRALYKLSKVFSDQPAPRNVADRVRRQIEKFKSYQALLNVICNPGIRDRHWKKVTYLNEYPFVHLSVTFVYCIKMTKHHQTVFTF